MKKLELGRIGEAVAAQYMESKGFRVVSRNYRTGHLELDLVCENGTHLVFVEVKTRTSLGAPSRYGRPARAVDDQKKRRLCDAAEGYLREHPSFKRKRIDVVEVYLTDTGELAPKGVHHIENALI